MRWLPDNPLVHEVVVDFFRETSQRFAPPVEFLACQEGNSPQVWQTWGQGLMLRTKSTWYCMACHKTQAGSLPCHKSQAGFCRPSTIPIHSDIPYRQSLALVLLCLIDQQNGPTQIRQLQKLLLLALFEISFSWSFLLATASKAVYPTHIPFLDDNTRVRRAFFARRTRPAGYLFIFCKSGFLLDVDSSVSHTHLIMRYLSLSIFQV